MPEKDDVRKMVAMPRDRYDRMVKCADYRGLPVVAFIRTGAYELMRTTEAEMQKESALEMNPTRESPQILTTKETP